MELLNLSLSYLVAELKPALEGAFINKVQEVKSDVFKLGLRSREGSKTLILMPNAFFLTQFKFPAKQQTSGYGAVLRKHLEGKKILSLEQHKADRVVVLGFEKFFLILELFAKGNIILCDREFKIVSAYRKEEWRDRSIKKSAAYIFPQSNKLNPFELSEKEFLESISSSEKDLVRALLSSVNIAPQVAEEACEIAGLEKNSSAKTLPASQGKKLFSAVRGLYSVDLKKLKPIALLSGGGGLLLPFEFSSQNLSTAKGFPSLNEAVDELCSGSFTAPKRFQPRPGKGLEGKIAALKHSMQLQKDSAGRLRERAEENRKKGEWVYANFPFLERLIKFVKEQKAGGESEKPIMYKINSGTPLLGEKPPLKVSLEGDSLVIETEA